MLGTLIKVAITVAPGKKELYPAWQGMQYMQYSTCVTCSMAGQCSSRWITIAIPLFAGRLRGMCSQRIKTAQLNDRRSLQGW